MKELSLKLNSLWGRRNCSEYSRDLLGRFLFDPENKSPEKSQGQPPGKSMISA